MSPGRAWGRLCVAASLTLSACTITTTAESTVQTLSGVHAPVYETSNHAIPQTHLRGPDGATNDPPLDSHYGPSTTSTLQDLHNGLETLQSSYFSLWLGKYTSAIDWTAAVMATHVSATLASLSRSLAYTMPGTFDKSKNLDVEAQMVENEINKYFGQITTYYFGEDHFAIRMQAYDDMLWVVLGWLESIQFVEGHSAGHYASSASAGSTMPEWHARQFIPAFAHRARVFYELAEKGWDWRLCGGGMTWNPRLLPYKNAITNQLFIAASVAMYLHFPGDANCSPFLAQSDRAKDALAGECDESVSGDSTYDPIYLANAVNGYEWLKNSGMTNQQGLYADGFHIAGYRYNHSKTECNERNEMVYTYNQGVVLSGLRGLWEATGKQTYLEDGHELVRNVVRATGWSDGYAFTASNAQQDGTTRWAGLGADGVLAEACDPSGTCNQDGQTFKGIFFHHLTAFCAPLPSAPARPGRTHAASRETRALHARSCMEYTEWVLHNGRAALRTRNEHGRFGSWWGADVREGSMRVERGENATDYRNKVDEYEALFEEVASTADDNANQPRSRDLNDRGRGRTVETQGSGVGVVRAMLEFSRLVGVGDDDELAP